MATLYKHFLAGSITDNPLASGATTITSPDFSALPTIASPNTMWLILDPLGTGGTPEIVQVTTHTAGATTVTATRGLQTADGGSATRSHASGTAWTSGLTTSDVSGLFGHVQRGTTTSAAFSGTPANASGTISFPSTFANTPTVVATCSAITGNTGTVCNVTSVTTTGFNYRLQVVTDTGTTTSTVNIHWIAIDTV